MKELYLNYKIVWINVENTLDTLFRYIQDYNVSMDNAGNITVTNTDEENVPAFCCHLDTVHNDKPSLVLIKEDILVSTNGQGVGGDDKCGIIACLEMLKRIPCKCIFFRQEESGCQGSKRYDQKSLKNNKFLIEIDRKSSSDLIFSTGYSTLCSGEFQKQVKKYFEGYEPATGALTDVVVLDKVGINMMNVSAGYYCPHTGQEYVILSELARTIDNLEKFAINFNGKTEYRRKNIIPTTTYRQQDMYSNDYNLLQYGKDNFPQGDVVEEDDYGWPPR